MEYKSNQSSHLIYIFKLSDVVGEQRPPHLGLRLGGHGQREVEHDHDAEHDGGQEEEDEGAGGGVEHGRPTVAGDGELGRLHAHNEALPVSRASRVESLDARTGAVRSVLY